MSPFQCVKICKTSVFISLWSTAKGPEKKAISSQPWIEYWVSVTHTFGPAGLDTVLYVYKSMEGGIFQHAQCIPAPFCRRLGKALYRFQEMPHKHLQQIHDPLSEKSALRTVDPHSISMHDLVGFLCAQKLWAYKTESLKAHSTAQIWMLQNPFELPNKVPFCVSNQFGRVTW